MRKTLPLMLMMLLLLGCKARLNREMVVNADGVTPKGAEIDPVPNAQTVKVSASAASGQFNVYLFLHKDSAEVEKQIALGKESPKFLAHELKTAKAELSAPVPANERAMVYVVSSDGKKMDVKLKITN